MTSLTGSANKTLCAPDLMPNDTTADQLIRAAMILRDELRPLNFAAPVTHVYCPLEYAWKPHETYLRRFGASEKKVVLLGMNPGPFGMAQTGVPFGEIPAVRDWMGIREEVSAPANEHPKRKVTGFDCTNSEVRKSIYFFAPSGFGPPLTIEAAQIATALSDGTMTSSGWLRPTFAVRMSLSQNTPTGTSPFSTRATTIGAEGVNWAELAAKAFT